MVHPAKFPSGYLPDIWLLIYSFYSHSYYQRIHFISIVRNLSVLTGAVSELYKDVLNAKCGCEDF